MNRDQRKPIRQLTLQDEITEFLFCTAPGDGVKAEVILNDETLWMSQQRMADLFNVGVPAISKHLKNIFATGELEEESVISILETTAVTGKKDQVKYYNLDFNKGQIREGFGKISRQQADAMAFAECEKFNKTQNIESDFDRLVKEIGQKKPENKA